MKPLPKFSERSLEDLVIAVKKLTLPGNIAINIPLASVLREEILEQLPSPNIPGIPNLRDL